MAVGVVGAGSACLGAAGVATGAGCVASEVVVAVAVGVGFLAGAVVTTGAGCVGAKVVAAATGYVAAAAAVSGCLVATFFSIYNISP